MRFREIHALFPGSFLILVVSIATSAAPLSIGFAYRCPTAVPDAVSVDFCHVFLSVRR
jgi:hypothetical protein